jgi:hypothetical protein
VDAGFEDDVGAIAAIAARWAAARNVLLPAKSDATVSAVAGLDPDFGFVNKHDVLGGRSEESMGEAYDSVSENPKEPRWCLHASLKGFR